MEGRKDDRRKRKGRKEYVGQCAPKSGLGLILGRVSCDDWIGFFFV